MPVHDWTRVSAVAWHAFHLSWIAELQRALNAGLLPHDHYAQAEQIIGPFGPDVLTLQRNGEQSPEPTASAEESGVSLATRPKTRWEFRAEKSQYASLARQLAIRHSSNDRIVAIVELVSPGNKSKTQAIRDFVTKALTLLERGVHLSVIDLFPPTSRVPEGLASAIWGEWTGEQLESAADEPLMLAAFVAGPFPVVHAEPTAAGKALIDLPLFLGRGQFVEMPLEATYLGAFQGVPNHLRRILELPAGAA